MYHTVHTYIPTYLPKYKPTYLPTHLHTHTCIHAYIHTYVHTYVHTYRIIYIHTYIAYIHTYIHNIVLDAKTVSVVWEPIPLIHPNHKNPHLPNNARLFAPGAAVWRWSATGQVAFSYALPCRKPQSSQYPLNP